MSRLYEAIQRGSGELADVLPQVLEETPAAPPAEGQAVPTEAGAPTVEAAPPPLPPPAAAVASAPAVRTVSISLAGYSPLLPFDGTDVTASEQYRVIRTRLIQHPRKPRLILVSSAGPRDGKSVTAVNIAGALSLKAEGSVLLADTDFRRSTIHTQLGLPSTPGLSDVLAGTATLEEAVVRTQQFPNLYVLPAGSQSASPTELLDSPRWLALREQLLGRFKYVIADSPPVASVADYELLQASCDGVVLVVRPDHTKRTACLRALDVVPKEKLLGLVMNCVDDWFMARRESYTAPAYYGSRRA
jgi:protein-tyrosine kinase